jgi:hypothetical protein
MKYHSETGEEERNIAERHPILYLYVWKFELRGYIPPPILVLSLYGVVLVG